MVFNTEVMEEIFQTEIEGVVLIRPRVLGDDRGYFMESFSARRFEPRVLDTQFVQDNEGYSRYGVLRGLHFQYPPHEQAKLVRVVCGRVLDVAVDIRVGSPTFGKHVARELSAENKLQLFIPRGFAHGYAVLSDEAVLQYKCDRFYAPESEGGIRYDDPALGIDWGVPADRLILSPKDQALEELSVVVSRLQQFG